MKRKKLFLVSTIIVFVGAVGFQLVDQNLHMLQSPGAQISNYKEIDYGLGGSFVDSLKQYPDLKNGEIAPFNIWEYAGRGKSSFNIPELPMTWEEWVDFHKKQKPKLMEDVRRYMSDRFDFNGEVIVNQFMSGQRKPVMAGPVARLSTAINSFEQLAKLSPEEIKKKDVFPYKPLAHPLHTTAHMVFPEEWNKVHPEHERIDLDHDFPAEYLPEFPPPMFLTTHKEIGDISEGREITLSNYYEIFNGLITAEQNRGLH